MNQWTANEPLNYCTAIKRTTELQYSNQMNHWTIVQRSNEPLNYCTAIKWTTVLLYSNQMNHWTAVQQSDEPLNCCTAIRWTTEQQMNHWTTVQQSDEPLYYCTAIKWTTELLYSNQMNHWTTVGTQMNHCLALKLTHQTAVWHSNEPQNYYLTKRKEPNELLFGNQVNEWVKYWVICVSISAFLTSMSGRMPEYHSQHKHVVSICGPPVVNPGLMK